MVIKCTNMKKFIFKIKRLYNIKKNVLSSGLIIGLFKLYQWF